MALTCGLPPTQGQRWIEKAVGLYQKSAGMIAPYAPELITAASTAGSHTTAALQLVAHGMKGRVKCPAPEFDDICEGGFLSPSKIMAKPPSIKRALDKGQIEYFHIRHEIVALCPELMRILSEADNAKTTTFAKKSMIQTMNAIHRRAVSANASDDAS